jgi:O-antigen ligase
MASTPYGKWFLLLETLKQVHAENDILQQFYTYGIIGIVLLTGLYASLYRQLRQLSNKPLKMVFLSLLLYIVVRGFAEAEPFDPLLPLCAIALFSLLVDQLTRSDDQPAIAFTYPFPENPVLDGMPQRLSADQR